MVTLCNWGDDGGGGGSFKYIIPIINIRSFK